jgi:hypothetical protein
MIDMAENEKKPLCCAFMQNMIALLAGAWVRRKV